MSAPHEKLLLDASEMEHSIQRLAFEILEAHGDAPMAFVGIHTRGIPFARRVKAIIGERNPRIRMGSLDITLYRDDLDNLSTIPSVKGSDLPFTVDGARILLFDDVLYTGRTIRAALNVLMDYGRPERIELCVLIDRGHRELPIAPTWCGRKLETGPGEHIRVSFTEVDGDDSVHLLSEGEA